MPTENVWIAIWEQPSCPWRSAFDLQSIDTKTAFLCLRSHEKHGDELKNPKLAFLDSTVRYRHFDPHGLVIYSFARYYRWLDNIPSGAINLDSKIYNPVHRQLMQEARKMYPEGAVGYCCDCAVEEGAETEDVGGVSAVGV